MPRSQGDKALNGVIRFNACLSCRALVVYIDLNAVFVDAAFSVLCVVAQNIAAK